MGYALSWAAQKAGSLQTMCSVLGLRPTGKHEEIAESEFVGAQLLSEWHIVLFNRNIIDDSSLKELSRSGDVIYCFVEDHVMFSSASAWNKGKEIWRVVHDGGEKGVLHLETTGNPPEQFEEVRMKLCSEQEAADRDNIKVDHVYEIPSELAKQLVGFHHDEDTPGLVGEAFEVLERVEKMTPKSALGKLFGRFGGRSASGA